ARARPRRRAQPAAVPGRGGRWAAALPGARADARPDVARVAFLAVRGDAPDLSTGRPRDLRDRRIGTQRLEAEREGFEPPELSLNGFQDRRHKPLGHLSAAEA